MQSSAEADAGSHAQFQQHDPIALRWVAIFLRSGPSYNCELAGRGRTGRCTAKVAVPNPSLGDDRLRRLLFGPEEPSDSDASDGGGPEDQQIAVGLFSDLAWRFVRHFKICQRIFGRPVQRALAYGCGPGGVRFAEPLVWAEFDCPGVWTDLDD